MHALEIENMKIQKDDGATVTKLLYRWKNMQTMTC
jgi:hypothetical protein